MAGSISKTYKAICLSPHKYRRIITVDWIGADDDGSVPDLVLNAEDLCIEGMFMYSGHTTPGAGAAAPTDDYDITVKDDRGVDIAGGLLEDRDTANAEDVNFGTGAAGFPIVRGDITVSIANQNAHSATGQLILVFTQE